MYTIGEYIRLKEMEANAKRALEYKPVSEIRKALNETKKRLPIHEDKLLK